MKRARASLLVMASLVGLPACHEENKATAPSGPGVLELVLSTPNGNDGAALLAVTGAVDSVQADGYSTFSALESGGARVVVTGDIAAGVLARLYVPDLGSADQYVANLVEVAQRASFALQDLTGYEISVRKAP